jgi:sugar phosphate isomerase/epimerase
MDGPRRNISVMASALSDDDARGAMSSARAMGFGGIVFDAHSRMIDLPALSSTGRRELAHLLRSNAQELTAIRADIGPRGFGPGADIDRLISGMAEVLQVARDLSAGVVLVDLGPLPEAVEPEKSKPPISPEMAGAILIPSPSESATTAKPQAAAAVSPPDPRIVSQVQTALNALCEIADRYQVRVAVSSSLSGFASLERAIKDARCPWLAINLDPVAMLHDRWSIDEICSRLGNAIAHVVARDAIRGDAGRIKPMPLGEGNVRWHDLLAALDAGDYRAWLTVDPAGLSDRTTALRAAIDRLTNAP